MEWHRAVKRYVLPELPGGWRAHGALLYPVPFDWLWCGLVMSTRPGSRLVRVGASVQLLAVPFPAFSLTCSVDLQQAASYEPWELPEDLDQAGPVMGKVHERIVDVALPFFAENGTLAGCAAFMEEQVRKSPLNTRFHEDLCYLRLLNGDVAGALQSADSVISLTADDDDPAPWQLEMVQQVTRVAAAARDDRERALAILREYAEFTRTKLRVRATP